MFTLAEHMKIVRGCEPQVSGSGDITGDYVSLKNYHKMWIVVHLTQGNAATTVLTPMKSTAVATAGSAVAANVAWWVNQDCATSDLLVRQADALTFTSSATIKHKIFVCEIDPAAHGATYDCYSIKVGDSHNANIFSAVYYLQSRYAADQPPSAIID